MMNHASPNGTAAGATSTSSTAAASSGDSYAREAEAAAGKLTDALDQARAGVVPPGLTLQVHAHGYRAVTFALLALRGEVFEHRVDTGNALTELDTTLGILSGAIDLEASPDDDLDDILDAAARTEDLATAATRWSDAATVSPTHVLTWFPRWEHGTAMWDIQPAPGWEHLDRPAPWPVPDLPPGRHATACQVEEWASGKLGYRVTAVRHWRLAISGRRLRAWPQPGWSLLAEVPAACDGTRAGVIATGADGRILVVPAERPGPLEVLALPSAHAGDYPWEEAGRGALAAARASAPRLLEGASGWRDDRCRLVPGPRGTGHNWMILTAPDATGSHGEWVTREELQKLADRTIGYAAGRIPASELDGPGLAPEWIGWLSGALIDRVPADDIACCARLAHA